MRKYLFCGFNKKEKPWHIARALYNGVSLKHYTYTKHEDPLTLSKVAAKQKK